MQSKGYIPALDGLRGIAILAVMVFHSENNSILKGGFIGVDIFFVLSGFLISRILTREYQKTGSIDLKNFYWRRSLRLLPALILLILAFLITSIGIGIGIKHSIIEALISLFYISNWVRAFKIYSLNFLGHTWSLAIEVQFYLIWSIALPFILKFFTPYKKAVSIVGLLALTSWGIRAWMAYNNSSLARLYNGLDTRSDGLLMGAALGVMVSFYPVERWKSFKWLSPIAIILLTAIALLFDNKNIAVYYYILFIVELSAAVLIIDAVSPSSFLRDFFEIKWLVWIGSISYGLYLWHFPIFKLMKINSAPAWEILIVGGATTFAISTLSYYFFEKPFLNLKLK
jgi:peptidoglycan/LPS O-acetylase OafA/YrhL